MIISNLDYDDVKISQNACLYRMAYEWLMIEKSYKGQEWFVKKAIDKGLMVVVCDKTDERFYAYHSEFEITLDRGESNPKHYKSETLPTYVRMLKFEKDKDQQVEHIPIGLKELYQEVYSEVVGAA